MLGRKHVDHITAHPKHAARKILVVARVLHTDQPRNYIALAHFVADAGNKSHLRVVLRRADAVDRTDRADDDGVAPLQHALGGRQAHLLDVFVDGRVFFNEQVTLRHVSFGLVVVVIADEVFDRVLREEFAKFAIQLRGQRFVGRKNDGRAPQLRDHVRHRESFARAGHAKQGLEDFAVVHALNQLGNRLRLVPRWRVGLKQLERRIRVAHERALFACHHRPGGVRHHFHYFWHENPAQAPLKS